MDQKALKKESRCHMPIIELSSDDVREIYRKVYTGAAPHGDFLTSFAQAVVYADASNFEIILPAALQLILKYKLDREPHPGVIEAGGQVS